MSAQPTQPLTATAPDLAPAAVASPPRVWGLTAHELHRAYWYARGIQPVRRGQTQRLQRAADAYLLIDPGQLVLFDLAKLAERLTWHHARITRIRLLDEHELPYRERVITDELGNVVRIERSYRPSFYASYRVIITPSRRIAKMWMNATSRREAWLSVRRAVSWAEVDHCRAAGVAVDDDQALASAEFIDRLVSVWPTPNQSIAGLEQVENGVWRELGSNVLPGVVRVAPLWLGHCPDHEDHPCFIGPAWIGDDNSQRPDTPHSIFVRDITDVALPEVAQARSRPHDPATEATAGARRQYHFWKRIFDVTACAIGLLCLTPILLLIAAAIWLDDGRPFFFGHIRQSRGGRQFRCWKFRTMHRDAHQRVAEFRDKNICDGPQVFIADDPRVTRVGYILRRTNLDELPQLWNVLIGHMSLVGPRPSPDGENQFCPAWRDLRLSVRPGIAGLWQLERRRTPGEDFQEWIKYDIEYVRRASFLFDLRIILRTFLMLIVGRSVHAPHQEK